MKPHKLYSYKEVEALTKENESLKAELNRLTKNGGQSDRELNNSSLHAQYLNLTGKARIAFFEKHKKELLK